MEVMGQKMLERPMRRILKAFELFDKDRNQKISLKDLKAATIELGENLTDDELREMIREADRDFDGEVSKSEFVEVRRNLDYLEPSTRKTSNKLSKEFVLINTKHTIQF